jgi:membrane-bound ClpP family serine protease
MAKTTIGLSIILILLGVISWLVTATASWTALIPAILGVVLLICGIIGLKRPKIGIHIALVIALLGVIGTFMNVLKLGDLFAGTAERPAAVIVSTVTFILLIAYIVAGVRSFIAARRPEAEGSRGLA